MNSPFLAEAGSIKAKSIGDEPYIPSKLAKVSKEHAPYRMVPFHTSFQYVMFNWKDVEDRRIGVRKWCQGKRGRSKSAKWRQTSQNTYQNAA